MQSESESAATPWMQGDSDSANFTGNLAIVRNGKHSQIAGMPKIHA